MSRDVADLLASRAEPPPASLEAKVQIWRAIERRTGVRSTALRATKIGILVFAIALAGTAAARISRAPAALEVVAIAPPAPTGEPLEPHVTAVAPVSLVAFAPVPRPPLRVVRELEAASVAPPAPPDPELATYKEARTAMRGDLDDALAKLTALLAAYPHGRFDLETRVSIIECKVRLGRLADAELDVEEFLARYGDSERANEIRFVRAEIQRQVHASCDRALADYRAAAASSRVADEAQFFRGWCAARTGDTAERDTALRDYLARWPAGRHANAARALIEVRP